MLHWIYEALLVRFALDETPVRILQYASVRGIGAFVTAFALVLLLGRRTANALYRAGMRDRVRDYGEFFNRSKSGTPTMGGVLIVFGIVGAAFLFCDPTLRAPNLLVLATLCFGAIGCADDFLKVRRGSSDAGLSRRAKLAAQFGFAGLFALLLLSDGSSPLPEAARTRLYFPFPGPDILAPWDLGWGYALFSTFAMVAIANAINFADGLDGLAVLPCALTAGVFGVFAYLTWNLRTAAFFDLDHLDPLMMQEVAIYSAAVVGACFGFLWFNGYPAQMFMGDTGSMALGGTIAALAALAKLELLFMIAGGIFVFEAFSVLLQDFLGIRLLGRRLFFRAPAHHGYQFRGLAETKVVLRFWLASILFTVLSLATLKLR